jgi:hypothetical protein
MLAFKAAELFESGEGAMKKQLDDLRPRNTQTRRHESSRTTRDALMRLATNAQDASALVGVYEVYGGQLKAAAVRWFGTDTEVRAKAINSILAAISRQAPSYDPQSIDARKWIRQCADLEARRLREALNASRQHRPRLQRAI